MYNNIDINGGVFDPGPAEDGRGRDARRLLGGLQTLTYTNSDDNDNDYENDNDDNNNNNNK